MKKKNPLLFALPLLAVGVLLVGCNTSDSSETDDDTIIDEGDNETSYAGLDDIYDWNEDFTGSTRPNYDDEFSYDSDYTPSVPDITGTVNVSFVLPDGVSLTESYLSRYSEVTNYSTISLPTDSDIVFTDDSISILGWYTYDSSTDRYSEITNDYYTVQASDVTIYACLTDGRGYEVSEFTRQSDGTDPVDYVYKATLDEDGEVSNIDTSTDYKDDSSFTISYYDYLVENKGGSKIVFDRSGDVENLYFRFLSVPENDNRFVEAGQLYDVHYTVANYSAEAVTLNVSQMTSQNQFVAGDQSGFITLEPNATTDFTLSIEGGTNGNEHLLSGIVVKGTVDNLSLGFELAISEAEEEADPDETPDEPDTPADPETVSVNFNLPDGASLTNDYLSTISEVENNSTIALPTDSDLNITDEDISIDGWYVYNSSSDTFTEITESSYTVGTDDVTIYACIDDTRGTDVSELTRQDNNNAAVDWAFIANLDDEGEFSSLPDESQDIVSSLTRTNYNYLVDHKYGKKLVISNSSDFENLYFRFVSVPENTNRRVEASSSYEIYYTIANYSSEAVTINVSQIVSSNNFAEGDPSGFFTLEPNETRDLTLNLTTSGQNSHLMTGVIVKGTVDNLSLGFEMSISDPL